ncbi:hypothetical protein [Nocardioides sp. SYSU DS0651]|uniref:hypothetical protein n=1 Tax=Nocardioides sp. SYSU DS0651 TaxID=3415955 RepID=UPI003F4B7272
MVSTPPSDVAALLQRAERVVLKRREVEMEALELLLAWADANSGDPQDEPGAVPVRFGGPRLISLGGEGTPQVSDLHLAEMAVARQEGVFTLRRELATAFDLRHRLPQCFAGGKALRCEPWVLKKVAVMSRRLTQEQALLVDEAVAAALDEPPGRILEIAEAKVIEADPVAHEERLRRNRERKGVWFPKPRPGEQVEGEAAGVAAVFARVDEADARAYARMVDDLADALATHAPPPGEGEEPPSSDHWRAEAFAMLADPEAVLGFLRSIDAPEEPSEPQEPSGSAKRRSVAHLHVHLSFDAVSAALGPVGRVEGLGPVLLSQVGDLLRRDDVVLTPVVDLNSGRSVNGYEHPTDVKARSELRTVGDRFPHAPTLWRRGGRPPDHDHTDEYRPHGPPGQTGDHNDTPLTRTAHRAKTHLGYSVFQLAPDRWVWGTPHGLYRLVTGSGTTRITAAEYQLLTTTAVELATDFPAA